MHWFDWVWLSALVLLGGFELWAVAFKREATLSEVTKRLFRTESSKVGRWIFLVLWGFFAMWFGIHIATGMV